MRGTNHKDKLLTSSQVARQLNVNINTVRRWNNQGILKAYRIGPRGDRRFSKNQLEHFLTESPASG
jgi:excisionase family DNA binding protein